LPASLAPLLSDGPIILLVLLVLTQTPDTFLNILRVIGGLFILYLARGAVLAMRTAGSPLATPTEAVHQNFFKAALMNALSPGPYIFWGVLAGPIVLEAWRQSPALGVSFVLGFYGLLIGGFALFIILFATASRFGPKVTKTLLGVSTVALLSFGLYQLWTGVTSLFG
jgi:threonine/homoserine/homoserine lactone efflux protein